MGGLHVNAASDLEAVVVNRIQDTRCAACASGACQRSWFSAAHLPKWAVRSLASL